MRSKGTGSRPSFAFTLWVADILRCETARSIAIQVDWHEHCLRIACRSGTAASLADRIIPRSITGNLSNKIIQKGLAFRCDRSATVLASGALLPLRDLAPPA